jgi:hypothetical protein
MLVGPAVVLREVDMQQLLAQAVEVVIPAVLTPLQLGVAAVQVEPEQRNPIQEGGDGFELVGAAERDVLHDDRHAEPPRLLAERSCKRQVEYIYETGGASPIIT